MHCSKKLKKKKKKNSLFSETLKARSDPKHHGSKNKKRRDRVQGTQENPSLYQQLLFHR